MEAPDRPTSTSHLAASASRCTRNLGCVALVIGRRPRPSTRRCGGRIPPVDPAPLDTYTAVKAYLILPQGLWCSCRSRHAMKPPTNRCADDEGATFCRHQTSACYALVLFTEQSLQSQPKLILEEAEPDPRPRLVEPCASMGTQRANVFTCQSTRLGCNHVSLVSASSSRLK